MFCNIARSPFLLDREAAIHQINSHHPAPFLWVAHHKNCRTGRRGADDLDEVVGDRAWRGSMGSLGCSCKAESGDPS